MRRSVTVFCVLLVACMVVLEVQAQSHTSHPIIGTWKLNLEKSSFDPGPGPEASVRRFVEREEGFIGTLRVTVGLTGNPGLSFGLLKFDGKDYVFYVPGTLAEFLATGTPAPTTAAFTVTEANTMQLIVKNDGESDGFDRTYTVSSDGKALTETAKGTNAQDESVNNVLVYDRVEQQ